MARFDPPPDFLSIEEKIEWNLSTGVYDPVAAADMTQLIAKMRSMNDSLTSYSLMIHRAMAERKLVLSQTQLLHAQIIHLKTVLNQIGSQALNAAQSTDQQQQPTSSTASPGASPPPPAGLAQRKLYKRIQTSAGVCAPDEIPFSSLGRASKKDKSGREWDSVVCPNCDAQFIDRGKECGIRDHLAKFKCPQLKHLRPASDPASETKSKKRKAVSPPGGDEGVDQVVREAAEPAKAAEAADAQTDDSLSELDDLVMQVKDKGSKSDSTASSPAELPSSLQNILQSFEAK